MAEALLCDEEVVEVADGVLLVAEWGSGNLVRVSGEEGKDRSVLVSDLGGPVGLAFDGKTSVYVTENRRGAVSRVDVSSGARQVVVEGLAQPEGIALAPDGSLVVAEVGKGRLVRIADGVTMEIASGLRMGLPPEAGAPDPFIMTGVAVSPGGTVYVTSDVEDAIYKFTLKQ